ncbi:MAG: homoserine kinase [Actinomycetota bacterium]
MIDPGLAPQVPKEPTSGSVSNVEVVVRVPATSANLGPGFDSFGLAIGLWDEIQVRLGSPAAGSVQVAGEGAGEVDTGADHLVAKAVRKGLELAGVSLPPGGSHALHLRCRNEIPHGRGLGSSASAVIAGLVAGRALAARTGLQVCQVSDEQLFTAAATIEGHPDNAAAALWGGLTVAWMEPSGPRARMVVVHPDITVVVAVPIQRLPTHQARAVLPPVVPHADAAATAARAALLMVAMTQDPSLLLPATDDWLHQRQRASAMPDTMQAVSQLRTAGWAAVMSGAGPSVMVLTTADHRRQATEDVTQLLGSGWRVFTPPIASGVQVDES